MVSLSGAQHCWRARSATFLRPVPSEFITQRLRTVARPLPESTRKQIFAPSGDACGYNSLTSGVFVRLADDLPSAYVTNNSQLLFA